MRDTIESFLALLRSPRTVSTYRAHLEAFLGFRFERTKTLEGETPSRTDLEAFLSRPREDGGRRSPAAWNQTLSTLRSFARHAVRERIWSSDPTDGIANVREPRRDPAFLTPFELRRLFGAIAANAKPALRERDLAIAAVLSQAGLRVSEFVALDVNQVDLLSQAIVGIEGKGETRRDVPLSDETVLLLRSWLKARDAIAHDDDTALFVSTRGTRISIRSTERLVACWRVALGSKKLLTPHGLRHTFVTTSLAMEADLQAVATLCGHADVSTTLRYAHLVNPRLRETVRRIARTIPKDVLPSPEELPALPFDIPGMAPNALDSAGIDPSTNPLDDECRFYGAA